MKSGIQSYFDVIKKHPSVILLLGCSFGPVISFIIYGPVMQKIAHGVNITILSSLGLASTVFGVKFHKWLLSKNSNVTHIQGVITCILLLAFSFLPFILQIVSLVLLGITSGYVFARWVDALALVKSENRIHVISLGLLLAYGSKFLSNILAIYAEPFLLTIIPAFLIACSVIVLDLSESPVSIYRKDKDPSVKYNELLFLIFLIYFTAGITYVGVFPKLNTYGFQKYFSVVPFLLAVFIAGLYVNNARKKYLLYGGISFLGLSFTFYAISSDLLFSFIVQSSAEISWAFLNVYVLVLLYDLASAKEDIGLFISGTVSLLCGILFGGVLTTVLISFFTINPAIYGTIAQILLFITVGFLSRIPEPYTNNDQPQLPAEPAKLDITKLLSGDFALTPREIDVALLLVAGYSNVWIAKQLIISPNTVKFHTKNIFNKMNVNNRNEIIKIVSDYASL